MASWACSEPQTCSQSAKTPSSAIAVVDVVAVLAAGEHAGVDEHGEVLGDVLLAGVELLGERVDAQLAVAEQVEHADAQRLAERAEAAGDQLGEVFGKRVWKRHAAIIL